MTATVMRGGVLDAAAEQGDQVPRERHRDGEQWHERSAIGHTRATPDIANSSTPSQSADREQLASRRSGSSGNKRRRPDRQLVGAALRRRSTCGGWRGSERGQPTRRAEPLRTRSADAHHRRRKLLDQRPRVTRRRHVGAADIAGRGGEVIAMACRQRVLGHVRVWQDRSATTVYRLSVPAAWLLQTARAHRASAEIATVRRPGVAPFHGDGDHHGDHHEDRTCAVLVVPNTMATIATTTHHRSLSRTAQRAANVATAIVMPSDSLRIVRSAD